MIDQIFGSSDEEDNISSDKVSSDKEEKDGSEEKSDDSANFSTAESKSSKKKKHQAELRKIAETSTRTHSLLHRGKGPKKLHL